MGRISIFLRLSLLASAFALLAFSVRAAHAQSAAPSQPVQPQAYGYVPVQGVDNQQPYGIKPIPGYTPPPQQAPMPQPQAPQPYGYAPLPQTNYAPAPQQPVARPVSNGPASNGYGYNGTTYGTQLPNDPQAYYQAPGPINSGYTMGPGDKLRLTIFGETDLSGEYQLDGNGNIRIPLAGMVHAAGNTQQTLERVIYSALVPNYLRNPRINVEITTYRPIYVLGQVGKPGQYAYVNDMTMLNAIGLAGGFTPQAKESTVFLRREGETKEQPVSTSEPLLIRPGDTVRVDTTVFWDAMNLFSPLSGPAALAATATRP